MYTALLEGLHGVLHGALTSVTRFIRPEAVADTWLGEQITWASRLRLEFVAQLTHIYPQIVSVVFGMLSPDLLQQLAMRHHLPSVVHECGQEFVFDRGEMDRLRSNRHVPSRQVDLELPNGKDRRVRLLRRIGNMAQRHTYTRQQLAHPKE